jgi:threonine/homoserine/homoserine lactone efflux protein
VLVAALVGLALGFVGSVPIAGPVSAIVLRRGLTRRYASAAFVGLGAGIAEGVYAFLAFWGFASFLEGYAWIDVVARGVAAVILLVLGVMFARFVAPEAGTETPQERRHGPGPSVLLGLTVTLINPTLLATWAATATTLHASGFAMTPRDALPFAVGTAIGISGWFAILAAILKRYGERFERRFLQLGVRGIGLVLVGVGLWFCYRFVVALTVVV